MMESGTPTRAVSRKKTLKQYTVREIEETDGFFMAAKNFLAPLTVSSCDMMVYNYRAARADEIAYL